MLKRGKAAAARREADERARMAERPAAAPGPYDASLKFCIKFTSSRATRERDVHFAQWKERSVRQYNRVWRRARRSSC